MEGIYGVGNGIITRVGIGGNGNGLEKGWKMIGMLME